MQTATTMLFAAAAEPSVMGRAVEIAAVGMLMVFAALALLTVFLGLVPMLLARLNAIWPEGGDHHAASDADQFQIVNEEDEVLAAIGFVLHVEARELP